MSDKHWKVIEMFPALADAIIAASTDTVTVCIHEVPLCGAHQWYSCLASKCYFGKLAPVHTSASKLEILLQSSLKWGLG